MPFAKINDLNMYYEVHGEGEPLVLITGFSADHLTWVNVLDGLAKQYQVIIFDNRGAGQTSVPPGPYTIEQMANDVHALCQHLHIQRAHFVGCSMGGFILQTLSLQCPDLVKSAILCNTTFNTLTVFNYYNMAQLELLQANAPLESIIKASLCWAFSYHFLAQPGNRDALVQLTLNNPHPFTLTGYQAQRAALTQFDSRTWAHQINVPTLVLGSDQDIIFLEASIKKLAETIPGATYYGFKECGHIPMIEYPQEFVEVVINFINQQ